MSGKRIVVGQSEWTLADENTADVTAQIKSALDDGTVAVLQLLDSTGKAVTVYLNGKVVATVEVDLDSGPRPSEIFG